MFLDHLAKEVGNNILSTILPYIPVEQQEMDCDDSIAFSGVVLKAVGKRDGLPGDIPYSGISRHLLIDKAWDKDTPQFIASVVNFIG